MKVPNPFRVLLDRVKAALGLQALTEIHADLKVAAANKQAELNAAAAEHEREGDHIRAAALRLAASQVTGFELKALDDVDRGLARLLKPSPLAALDAGGEEEAPAATPAALPPALIPTQEEAARRGPGRPRKGADPSTGERTPQ